MKRLLIAATLMLQSCLPTYYYATTPKEKRTVDEQVAVWVMEAAVWRHAWLMVDYYRLKAEIERNQR